ncbi:hypothetical protein DPMN_186116 [Dreissena polymorpha]|uniref:Uncharacterized protein n=1 Tax=Dreissena polymorpha TaxID=45954 RepID=A0A9D4DLS5_DREPO|nr:hypothetical protein DPMN_186116 [Dreissena polymorpha]
MSDFVDGGKFDIVWDGLMEEVVMSEEDFANQFGKNPSVFNEPFDEITNANVNLNKSYNLSVDHLDEYLATDLLSIRKNDNDEYEPVTLRSIVGSIDGNFKAQSTHTLSSGAVVQIFPHT